MAPLEALRLAGPDRLVYRIAAGLVGRVAVEHEAGRAADELVLAVAEDLLEAPVAAGDLAILGEDDADERVLQHRVLLAHQALERLVGALSLGDVFQQPDITLARVARLHRPAADPAPEARAVLAPQPRLPRMRAAGIDVA